MIAHKSWNLLVKVLLLCLLLASAPLPAGPQNSVPRFAYVVNPYDYTISQYGVDADGLLYANGMTFVGDKFPALLVVHPNQRYIYVASRTVDTIRGYAINPRSGDLKEIDGSPFDSLLRSPFYGVFHPSGRFLYLAGRGGGVGAYTIDGETGKIGAVAGQPFKSGERTRSIAMHPSGQFLYAANAYTNDISAYKIDNKTGALTQLVHSPFAAGEAGPFDDTISKLPDIDVNKGGLPYAISVHPSGDFVFVSNFTAGSISVFRVNQQNGDLQLIGTPVPTGLNPFPNTVHPNGRFLYVATWGDNNIWVYEINQQKGTLSLINGALFETKTLKPVDLTISQDGKRLYVSSIGSREATVFSLDPDNGKLSLMQNIRSRDGALDIEVVHASKPVSIESKFAFVLSSKLQQLVSYRIDRSTGDFKYVTSVKTGKNPTDVAHDPKGRTVYVTDGDSGEISIFSIDSKSGKLATILGSPHPTGQLGIDNIAIDANGWYAYAISRKSNTMSMYLMHADTGELAEARGSPQTVGEQPSGVFLDNLGQFAYVISPTKKIISIFRFRSAITAALDEMTAFGSPITTTDKPAAFASGPNGRFAILANADKDSLSIFQINFSNGVLLEIEKGSPFAVGKEPIDIGFEPKGRYVYAANRKSKEISILEMNKVSGELSLVNTVSLSKAPESITIEPSGRYLYVISTGLKGFMRFEINSDNGLLTKKDDVKLDFIPTSISISKVYK